jgi:exonuclease III
VQSSGAFSTGGEKEEPPIDPSETQPEGNSLTFLHLNAQSISNKFPLIELIGDEQKPDCLCISETFLTAEKAPNFIMTGYKGFHFCRKYNRPRGGTSIFVKTCHAVRQREDVNGCAEDHVFEISCVEIAREHDRPLVVAAVYRTPPKSPNALNSFFDKLITVIDKMDPSRCDVVLMGDFNIDLNLTDPASVSFKDLVGALGLKLLIQDPTRKGACLDNIITSENQRIFDAKVIELGIADHAAVMVKIPTEYSAKVDNQDSAVVVSRFDSDTFIQTMESMDFTPVYRASTVDEKYDTFMGLMLSAYEANKTDLVKRKKAQHKTWVTNEVRVSSRQKRTFFATWAADKENLVNMSAYKNHCKAHDRLVHRTKLESRKAEFANCENDKRKIWKFMNECRGKETDPGPTSINVGDQVSSDPSVVSKEFGKFFSGIQTAQILQQSGIGDQFTQMLGVKPQPVEKLELYDSDAAEVYEVINKLKIRKAAGIDALNASACRSVAHCISLPLSHIFNASVQEGQFPANMKLGKMVPIYKKGNRKELANYRPVTILPVLSKVFERMVYNRLYAYFSLHNLLSESQYGFRKQRSTQDAILSFLEHTLVELENGKIPVGISYDLSKAFDTVNHGILLSKLEFYGCSDLALGWFKSYLSDRENQVVLTNHKTKVKHASDSFSCDIGVPQGSILGPLLFIIYINDIPNCFPEGKFDLFADDSNVSFSTHNINSLVESTERCNQLVSNWVTTNGLKLNEDKTAVIVFRNQKDIRQVVQTDDSTKFLGVHIDEKLTFTVHFDYVAQKVKAGIYCLRNLRDYIPRSQLLEVYYALVQSHLTYCILCWGYSSNQNVDRLVKLQKWALRTICRKKSVDSCRSLFSELGIMTFPSIFIYHACKKTFEFKLDGRIQTRSSQHSYDLRNNNELNIERLTMKKTEKLIAHIGPLLFNRLPDKIKNIPTPRAFATVLKTYLINAVPYSYSEFLEISS